MNNQTQTPNLFPAYLAEIKARVGMEWVLNNHGVTVARRRFSCISPAHSDLRPSASVNPDDQSFVCWSCGVRGDVIDAVQLIQGLSVKDATEYLGRFCGVGTYREYAGLDKTVARARWAHVDMEELTDARRAAFVRLARMNCEGNRDAMATRCVEFVVDTTMEKANAE